MKKKILELLATKFAGVDSKIFEGLATKLAETATTDEEAQTAVDGVTFAQVLQSYGDARATQASETAVKNYEKKNNLKDGKPIVDEEAAKKAAEEAAKKAAEEKAKAEAEAAKKAAEEAAKSKLSPEVQALLKSMEESNKALLESNKALAAKVDTLQGDFTALKAKSLTADRSAVLSKTIEKLTAAQKAAYKYVDVTKMTDEEFNTFIDEVKGNAADLVKENEAASSNSRPQIGNIAVKGKATDAEIKGIVDAIAPSQAPRRESNKDE